MLIKSINKLRKLYPSLAEELTTILVEFYEANRLDGMTEKDACEHAYESVTLMASFEDIFTIAL